jgi:hypothetical protein
MDMPRMLSQHSAVGVLLQSESELDRADDLNKSGLNQFGRNPNAGLTKNSRERD